MSYISYRIRGYPPQDVFVDGIKAGHVEYTSEGDGGWNAYDRADLFRGFAKHKAEAGRFLADYAYATQAHH